MFNRRKRIPYDPPSARKKKRRRPAPLRADQLFISRRMLLIKGTVVASFAALAGKLGYMQVIQGQEYEQAARDNVVRPEQIKASRGLIYDRAGRPMAENRRSWVVRIIPEELPNEETQPEELKRVKETLITALRLPNALVVNPPAVPLGSEDIVYKRVALLLGDDEESAQARIEYIKRESARNYLVLVEPELTSNQVGSIRAAMQELPGVEVLNYLDYLIGNSGDPRLPILCKHDVSRDIALKLEANRLYLPGVQLDDNALVRQYLGGPVMSHLLGYVGTISEEEYGDPDNETAGGNPIYAPDDIIGKDGIERTFEDLLRGQKGGRWVEKDGHGVIVREVPGTANPPVPGKNLRMTLDLELQATISWALENCIQFSNEDRHAADLRNNREPKEYKASAGAVVAIDPRNGEVLAMVSFPHYDNQLFIDGISNRKYSEYQDPAANKPLINRAVNEIYPPGSTIKPFLAAGALREKTIDEGTKFTCTGAIRVPWDWNEAKGTDYVCWNKEPGHGELDVYGAIEQSCDVFFYNVGTPKQRPEGAAEDLHYFDLNVNSDQISEKHFFDGLGIDNINTNLERRFWFGRRTGIDLPWESPGLVPDPKWKLETIHDYWSSGDTIITSIGQGELRATPLQMALNVAAIANDGKIYKPLLVKEVVDDTVESVQGFDPQLLRDMRFNKRHLDIVRKGMRGVVHSDTGSARRNADGTTKWPLTNPEGEEEITIGGKTGTAEFGAVNEEGEYEQQHAWFTCYAPFDDPEIAVAVIVENGGEGSSYAVPVADRVLRAYFELTGKRPRGKMLREDKQPISDAFPPADPSVASPRAGAVEQQPGD